MSAYKCWCNQNEIVTCGKVSDNEYEATPRQFPVIQDIDIVKDTTLLVFQISNFHHRAGGFFTTPKIGLKEDIFRDKIMKIAFDLFLFGSILIISLYHFGLSFMRREKLTSLYFGLFTLIMAIRTIFTGSFVISIPFPDISWFLKYRIEYLTLYLSPLFILSFFYNIYRKDINLHFSRIFIGICILYAFTTLLPTVIFTELMFSFFLVLGISIAYLFTRLIKTVIRKRLGAKILFSSVLILFLTTINDVLLMRGYVHNTIELVPFGTFIFVLGQSLVLAKIFSDAFNKKELLTIELNYQNINLEKIIQKRTVELVHQKEELQTTLEDLKSTQSQLIQSEKMASLGELTAGIAHEIQNPLNFVNNFSEVNQELLLEMKEEIDKGKMDEAKALANDVFDNEKKINHHGKRADSIVKGMLQHSRSSSGVKELTDINALADEFLRLSYHGLRAKDKTFNASLITDFDSSIGKIKVVPEEIRRVILNLLNNAFYAVTDRKKFNAEGYEPVVSIGTKLIGDQVEIRVSDNGNGMPQKVMDKIFQPFFTTKPAGQGAGLGLSMSYDIVTKGHEGKLMVDTTEGEGSTFYIYLPYTS